MKRIVEIYLDRGDLLPNCNKDISDIFITDIKDECFKHYYEADLVVFIDDDGKRRILKDRNNEYI